MNTTDQSLSAKNIRVKESMRGATIVYQRSFLRRLWATVFGLLVIAATLWIVTVVLGYFDDVSPIWYAVFVIGSFGFIVLVFLANRTEFSVEDGLLIRRTLPMPRFFTEYDQTVPLSNLQRVGADPNGGISPDIVAYLINGKEVKLINGLPEADGEALCQALHQHLGVPI